MENTVLRKRLSTFKSAEGKLTRVADDLIIDILRAWESWTGTSKEFYQNLELSKQQLAILIKKGKKLSKSGDYPMGDFKEIKVESSSSGSFPGGSTCCIEISWEQGKVIRFSQVEQLVDFLKKVA